MSGVEFESLWGALPHPCLLITPEGTIDVVNSAAENQFLSSKRQLIGQSLAHFIGSDSAVLEIVTQIQAGAVSVNQHITGMSWLERQVPVSTVQGCTVDGHPGYVLLLFHTPGLSEKLDRSLAHRSAARSVTGMAAMLAHEIRNPLAGIAGAAQFLAMSLSEEDQEMTTLIEEEARRIGKLVERFEQFGDMRPATRSEVNVHDVLDKAKRSAQAGYAKHHRFVEEYDPSLPSTTGDPLQLLQVFQNLIKNAAEAIGPNPGVVTLRTEFQPGIKMVLPGRESESLPLKITVSDTGPGISEELLDDIFEPFVSSKSNGSGLGLSLVSKILANHGGIVEYQRTAKRTDFQVMLPVWRASGPAEKEIEWTAQ